MNARFLLFVIIYFVCMAFLDIVLIALWPFTVIFDRKRRRAIFTVFWAFNRFVTRWFWTVRFTGMPFENIRGPVVIVANHQTLWDHVFCFVMTHMPRTVMKGEIKYYPLVGLTCLLLDQVFVYPRSGDPRNAAALDRCVDLLRSGVSVSIFPEGTRRWKQQPGVEKTEEPIGLFKAGAFKVAAEAKVPIVPVVIEIRHLINDRTMDVWPGVFHVHVLDPVDTSSASVDEIRDLVRMRMIDALPLVEVKSKSS